MRDQQVEILARISGYMPMAEVHVIVNFYQFGNSISI